MNFAFELAIITTWSQMTPKCGSAISLRSFSTARLKQFDQNFSLSAGVISDVTGSDEWSDNDGDEDEGSDDDDDAPVAPVAPVADADAAEGDDVDDIDNDDADGDGDDDGDGDGNGDDGGDDGG